MKPSAKGAAAVLAALLITAPVLLSDTANAASDAAPPPYCAILVGKSASVGQPSSVLAESCSETSAADADAGLHRAVARRGLKDTVLMIWYADAGWKGTSLAISGSEGTCDSAGYKTWAGDWWGSHLSSIRGDRACNTVVVTSLLGYKSDGVALPWSFGALIWNDNVYEVDVFHR
jgi:hypothetical protein